MWIDCMTFTREGHLAIDLARKQICSAHSFSIPQPQNRDIGVENLQENVVDGRVSVGSEKNTLPSFDECFEDFSDGGRLSRSRHSENESIVLHREDLPNGARLIGVEMGRNDVQSRFDEDWRFQVDDQSSSLFVSVDNEELNQIIPNPSEAGSEFVLVDTKDEIGRRESRNCSLRLSILDE